ncbi:unnamed protein product [Polarella glacialis]|uniref:Uncharacterized protein n=1 Tax=Polarella glacialis TaxID=89957 RepID=A0A813E943_POLGL|nr:unnamed protein product [Polarella glacialis]
MLWQLVTAGATSVTLADREEKHFALDPKCCTEKTHPNNCWSPLTDLSWVVHHVGPRAVRCMFRTDIQAGYYQLRQPTQRPDARRCLSAEALSALLPGDDIGNDADSVQNACAPVPTAEPAASSEAYEPRRDWPLPSLCGCVYTPPAHPGQPKPGSPMQEGADGPSLH